MSSVLLPMESTLMQLKAPSTRTTRRQH
eukprot:COSAG02_NODE_55389_length_290_cov_297.937173_1_plen_27_part_10